MAGIDGGLAGSVVSRGRSLCVYLESDSWCLTSLRWVLRMLSKPRTKQYLNLGMVSLMFWNSCSLSSRVFLTTCVRWYVFAFFDLGILRLYVCVGVLSGSEETEREGRCRCV